MPSTSVETFAESSRRVREAYQARDARTSSRRPRRPREWAGADVNEPVGEGTTPAPCDRRAGSVEAYAHPGCHRTSDLVGRLPRRLDDHPYRSRRLPDSPVAAERGLRGRGLVPDFAPSCPWTERGAPGLRSPAERLNAKRYHPEWLQDLPVSASLGGDRSAPRKA